MAKVNSKSMGPKGKKSSRAPAEDGAKVTKKQPFKQRKGTNSKRDEFKTRGGAVGKPKEKKKRVYTDAELGIPQLNMITPAGVTKPKGKKKGKVFVDDEESMMTILAMVNADKDGQIESKMIKARQLEQIREARRVEMEKRKEAKKEKLEDVKNGLKKKKSSGKIDKAAEGQAKQQRLSEDKLLKKTKKRVSFG